MMPFRIPVLLCTLYGLAPLRSSRKLEENWLGVLVTKPVCLNREVNTVAVGDLCEESF